jgi:23S rRNA (adenine1618-N6)-methyltransferase
VSLVKGLHTRNHHNERYDFKLLIIANPTLEGFVLKNEHGEFSIDFSNSKAVIALNKALLKYFYKIDFWEIPKNQLCPGVPGRADYIHYLADMMAELNGGEIPLGPKTSGLDIGVGANCIYPLIGNSIYGWKFVGVETNSDSLNCAKLNSKEFKNIKCRFQKDDNDIFMNIISKDEKFDFTMCNPPFHNSKEDAAKGSERKSRRLNTKGKLNFGGKSTELWCTGGELGFIKRMIQQSFLKKENSRLFTTLVSRKENLEELYKELEKVKVESIKTIEMHHGNKISHILAWSFEKIKRPTLSRPN